MGVTDQLVHQHVARERYLQAVMALETEVRAPSQTLFIIPMRPAVWGCLRVSMALDAICVTMVTCHPAVITESMQRCIAHAARLRDSIFQKAVSRTEPQHQTSAPTLQGLEVTVIRSERFRPCAAQVANHADVEGEEQTAVTTEGVSTTMPLPKHNQIKCARSPLLHLF